MINEANAPSSACHNQRIGQVETSTPPSKRSHLRAFPPAGQAAHLPHRNRIILTAENAKSAKSWGRHSSRRATTVPSLSFIFSFILSLILSLFGLSGVRV